MCDFEGVEIISKYTRPQAVDDGVLVELLYWNGLPVIATSHIAEVLKREQLLEIWKKFLYWKQYEEQLLPEEQRLFSLSVNHKNVWVVEDGVAFTLMFSEDY